MKDLRGAGGKSGPAPQPDAGNKTEKDVRELVDKYGSKSPSELLSELRAGKRNGLINDEMLAAAAEKMTPMLNAEQQARLNEILKQLGG